jgi:hypothetical protein
MHVIALAASASTVSPYILILASLSMPRFFSDHEGATPWFSPHYAEIT